MKNLFLFAITIFTVTSFYACRKCTSCKFSQQLGNGATKSETPYEKCGSKTEVANFKSNLDELVKSSTDTTKGNKASYSCIDK